MKTGWTMETPRATAAWRRATSDSLLAKDISRQWIGSSKSSSSTICSQVVMADSSGRRGLVAFGQVGVTELVGLDVVERAAPVLGLRRAVDQERAPLVEVELVEAAVEFLDLDVPAISSSATTWNNAPLSRCEYQFPTIGGSRLPMNPSYARSPGHAKDYNREN